MTVIKAVILEKTGLTYTVLASDGTFRKVRRFSRAQIGEEIEITHQNRSLPVWASVAALFLLIITATLTWNYSRAAAAVAVLSVDINPSLELKLDNKNRVLDAIPQNSDASHLLEGMNYKGQPESEVLEKIIDKAVGLQFLNQEKSWVLLGVSPTGSKGDSVLSQINLAELAEKVQTKGSGYGLSLNVAAFKLTSSEENSALAKGLTAGEYALWLTSQEAGFSVPAGSMRDSSERARMLAEPQVQAQAGVSRGTLYVSSNHLTGKPSSSQSNSSGTSQKTPVQPQVNDRQRGEDRDREENKSRDENNDHRSGDKPVNRRSDSSNKPGNSFEGNSNNKDRRGPEEETGKSETGKSETGKQGENPVSLPPHQSERDSDSDSRYNDSGKDSRKDMNSDISKVPSSQKSSETEEED